jgi:hypothetical protein
MIEPVFAQVKNRGLDRFQRRGRDAVRTEWRLITATHNLGMKLLGQVSGGAVRSRSRRRANRDRGSWRTEAGQAVLELGGLIAPGISKLGDLPAVSEQSQDGHRLTLRSDGP